MNTVEIETKSKPAKHGDYVVARIDENGQPAEQYLVTDAKFPTLYDVNSAVNDETGWLRYKVISQDRLALIWTPELQDLLEIRNQYEVFNREVLSQAQLVYFIGLIPFKHFRKVKKHSEVLVRHAEVDEVVVTKVVANDSPLLFEFEAAWDERMPVKMNDVLIVLDDEIYRIARHEFDLTYIM